MKKIVVSLFAALLFTGCIMDAVVAVKGATFVEENSNWRRAGTEKAETEFGEGYLCESDNVENLLSALDENTKTCTIQISDINPNLDDIANAIRRLNSSVNINLDLSKCTGLNKIGNSVFFTCSKLTGIILPDSVTYIGDEAFKSCVGLLSIEIPDSVLSIGKNVFSGCSSLKKMTIPFVGLTAYKLDHFYYLFGNYSADVPKSLKEVVITGGDSILDSYFYECSGLERITIPDSITSIGWGIFYGCRFSNLIYNKHFFVYMPPSYSGSYEIPNGITCIYESAFANCSGLTGITIPDSVSYIGDAAFFKCTGLTSLNIPNSITNIDSRAFYGCSNLTSMTIPDNVRSIGYHVFYDCSLLTTLTVKATTPPSFGDNVLYGCDRLTTIYVPSASVDAYKAADGWSSYASKITAGDF